ncbi:MAG: RNA 2',3'-cyclic phosphodiesterase [Hyphomicrobium aestuarii]|nr:RNA 2',3'-cyclic phosphodiesterase [Hyphomicrobium aestuarii]
MPRLFAGLEIPEDISSELSALEEPIPGVNWVDEDDLHVTLRFFGDISDAQERDLLDLLDTMDCEAFEVAIDGLGTFGNDPHSIHAIVKETPALSSLARQLDRIATAIGCPRTKHPFRPHITVARMSFADPVRLTRFLSRNAVLRFEPFFMHRFALYSSRPRTGGGPYAIEGLYALRGGLGAGVDEDGNPW